MLRIQTLNTPHKFHAVGGRHSFHPPASNCGQLFPKGYVDNRDEPRTKLGGGLTASRQAGQTDYLARPQPKNRPEAYPLGYVEDLFEVRTQLGVCFSSRS